MSSVAPGTTLMSAVFLLQYKKGVLSTSKGDCVSYSNILLGGTLTCDWSYKSDGSAHAGIGYVCNILRLTTNSKAISAQPTPGCTLSYQSFAVRSFTPAIVACSSETKVGWMGVTYHISSPPPCNLASVVWTTRLVLDFPYKLSFLMMLMQSLCQMPGNKR